MKRYFLITLVFVMAAGLMMGCSSNTQANEEHEKALAGLRTELEEVQTELKTVQDELAAVQAENARLLEQINVVDTPEQAQAEQSTQGAADKTQQQAPSGQQAIEDDLNKQIPEKTTPPKTDKLPDASSSQAQNPSEQDVNDYLNDILNGGGSGSKPSGGSSGSVSPDDIFEADPNAGPLGGGGNVDDFNWD